MNKKNVGGAQVFTTARGHAGSEVAGGESRW